MSNDLLIASNISKRFGITQALDDVSVSFRAGEVHALMGENGAGKSTLGKAIAGLHRPDAGTVQIAGHTLTPGSIDDAFEHGVRIVHQELAQCPNLSVAENLTLHDLPSSMGFVKRREMLDRAAALVHRLDPGIDVTAPLERLSPGRRQIVQIASALEERSGAGHQVRVIVFDEPTSSLSVAEADRLLEITRELANKGLTIIYVSHRMGEIFQVCDRVTVLRDGKFVATSEIAAIDEPTLVEQMIGRRIETAKRAEFAAAASASQQNLLEVRALNSGRRLRDINLNVRAGEVVGIGGLVGSGRSELLNAIFGIDPGAKGEVTVVGKDVSALDARGRILSGLGYVPEDRRLQGLFFELDISQNITIPFMAQLAGVLGFRGVAAERDLVDRKMADFKVKAASPASRPGELSGGNQQKLLIARWMGKGTRVLLLDEPTRGIDVGTKAEVYRLVREAAAGGTAVLLVSSEMPELLALSDRVLVMCEGGISGELTGAELTQANILNLATVSTRARRA